MASCSRVAPEAMQCTTDVLDRGVVSCSDDTGGVARLRHSPFFFLFSLCSLGSGAQWTATKVVAGRWDEL